MLLCGCYLSVQVSKLWFGRIQNARSWEIVRGWWMLLAGIRISKLRARDLLVNFRNLNLLLLCQALCLRCLASELSSFGLCFWGRRALLL